MERLRGSRHAKTGSHTALALTLASLLLSSGVASAAGATRDRPGERVKALCEAAPADSFVCASLAIVPASLTQAAISTNAQREAQELAAGVSPAVTFGSPWPRALTPQLLRGAYTLPAETSASAAQTVAVVDAYNDPSAEADLAVFDQTFALPECTTGNGCFHKVNQEGNVSPLPPNPPIGQGGWIGETSLDVQMARAICQSCHVLLVEGNDASFENLGLAVNGAVKAGATEVSNSYESTSTETAAEQLLNEKYYKHAGVVIAASAGDCGYRDQNNPDGDANCNGRPNNASFPASSPNVVAVGGTSLTESAGSWASTVWGNTGGGCSSVFSAPVWQTGTANWSSTGCGTERLLADIAAVANPHTGVNVYVGTPMEPGFPTGWFVFGGTSASSPIVAGEYGLAGGARGVEYPARTPYSYIGASSDLYDVVSGANGNCGKVSCVASAGYDGPSGVGSPVGLGAFSPTAGSPANTALPSISGTAEKGHTLTATAGKWTLSPTAAGLQWEDCNSAGSGCVPIQSATASTYTLTWRDEGSTIRVQETVSNASGFGPPASSTQTALVPVPPGPAPLIKSLTPKKGIATDFTQVTITGTGFAGASSVKFGATATAFHINSETSITTEAPPGAGSVLVSVTTPNGTNPNKKNHFRYKLPRKRK
jgi:hypothetical protein